MPYIGNTIRAADDYRLIDDISSSFNGSTTSFALQVAGSAPVPFPKSPQQVLISVNGVIQEPDPTGASGFNLVGTNIVFSSAPTNGHAFFGIIYATADYLNSGGNFPTGSLGAPSITFVGDEDTGIYRKGSGSVGFVSDATEIANFDSNGITISSGSLIIPDSIIHNGDTNTKIRFSGADTVSVETAGTQRLEVASDGKVNFGSVARVEADGVFKAAHGDASTPAYNFLNDNDNGMFRATTNELGFSTAGTERLRIDNNGFVGVGTNNPGVLLDVVAASGDANFRVRTQGTGSGDDTVIRALVNNTTSSNYIQFGDTGDSNSGQIRYQHSNDSMQFTTNAAEVVRIDSSGRVGIGTSSPERLLHVTGSDCRIRLSDSDVSPDVELQNSSGDGILATNSTTNLIFKTNNAERLRIDSSGNVGIGTSSPATPLHIKSDTPYIRFEDDNDNQDWTIEARAFFGIHDVTDNAFRFAIDGDGNVGIGTISPQRTLHLSSNNTVFALTDTAASTDQKTKYILSDAGVLAFGKLSDDYNTATEQLRIDNSGRVGIGISSIASSTRLALSESSGNAQTLEIIAANNSGAGSQPGIKFTNNSGGNTGGIFADTNSGQVRLQTGGTDRLTINSSGNVGIGTTSPVAKFHVHNPGTGSGDHAYAYFTTGDTGATSSDGLTIGVAATAVATINYREAGVLSLGTSSTERIRINSSGKVMMGTTVVRNLSTLTVKGTGQAPLSCEASATTGFSQIFFVNPNGNVGQINSINSETRYFTTSDYRLKENIIDLTGAITRLKTLQPKRFNWISDETNTLQDGFLAHEVTAVPEAITGTKDEVDSDNNPVYQMIDNSKLVPLLTAALQEEITKREALETRIAALESA